MNKYKKALSIIFKREINIRNVGDRYEDYIYFLKDPKLIPTRKEYEIVKEVMEELKYGEN